MPFISSSLASFDDESHFQNEAAPRGNVNQDAIPINFEEIRVDSDKLADDDVHVRDTDAAGVAIKATTIKRLKDMVKVFKNDGFTKEMEERFEPKVANLIGGFAKQNKGGSVMSTIVIEKLSLSGGWWTKECQAAVGIDADAINPKLKQNGHLGCEVYFAKTEDPDPDNWTRGRRQLKMHAYLPDEVNPPHYRNEGGGDDPKTFRDQFVEDIQGGPVAYLRYRFTTTTWGYK